MKKNWIDFKALRARLDFAAVLEHYGVEVKRKGNQHHGFCPLPNHNGKKNSPSFSANLEKGIFQCFGCGAKGNILDFALFMEKADPETTPYPSLTKSLSSSIRLTGSRPRSRRFFQINIFTLPRPSTISITGLRTEQAKRLLSKAMTTASWSNYGRR